MPKSQSPTVAVAELKTCTECRKRKRKCSGSVPCLYCTRSKKACIFGPPPCRTPLTRRNLDEIERRCTGLMMLLQTLDPGLDIENALKTVGSSFAETDFGTQPQPLQSILTSGTRLSSADVFEWNESQVREECLDGMASLPTGSADTGYLGDSAGTSLLRAVPGLVEDQSPNTRRRRRYSVANGPESENMLLSSHLGSSTVLDTLIDTYFRCYNPSYPILHENTFRKQYEERQKIDNQSIWHSIFYLVLAIGDWIVSGKSAIVESKYYAAARSRMSLRMLESGTTLTVQAFLLMGNYLQKLDRPNTGYIFIGIAQRMSLGLGLHREPPAGQAPDSLYNERRRVIWWIVYSFDSGFSLTTGRPVMISDSFIETRLPANVDDSHCTLESVVPEPTGTPTTYSAIIAQAQLASICNMIHNDVISAPKESSFDLKTSRLLDHRLKMWKLSLPVYFASQHVPEWFLGPRAVVGWKEQNLRMMLWWGSQRLCKSLSDTEEARNMCHFAAIETIQDITVFCINCLEGIHTGINWYATYFLFQASIVLSIQCLVPSLPTYSSPESATHELWYVSILRARDCLESLGRSNEAATRCLEVLDRIRNQSQQSSAIQLNNIDYQNSPPPPQVTSERTSFQQASSALAIDPSLKIFFEDVSWCGDVFDGMQGFPGTDEIETFDFLPANTSSNNDF